MVWCAVGVASDDSFAGCGWQWQSGRYGIGHCPFLSCGIFRPKTTAEFHYPCAGDSRLRLCTLHPHCSGRSTHSAVIQRVIRVPCSQGEWPNRYQVAGSMSSSQEGAEWQRGCQAVSIVLSIPGGRQVLRRTPEQPGRHQNSKTCDNTYIHLYAGPQRLR